MGINTGLYKGWYIARDFKKEKYEKIKEICCDYVDIHFPKGESKERGKAIVLVGELVGEFLSIIDSV